MKTLKFQTPTNQPAPISDVELAEILENSAWAKMEREAKEFAEFANMFRKVA
jgi:hypothetical protein